MIFEYLQSQTLPHLRQKNNITTKISQNLLNILSPFFKDNPTIIYLYLQQPHTTLIPVQSTLVRISTTTSSSHIYKLIDTACQRSKHPNGAGTARGEISCVPLSLTRACARLD